MMSPDNPLVRVDVQFDITLLVPFEVIHVEPQILEQQCLEAEAEERE